MVTVLIFGDSIAYGLCDKDLGWASKLRQFLEQNTEIKPNFSFVYNLSIPGDNTNLLMQRFAFEAMQRIDYPEETIVLFALGLNDCAYNNKTAKAFVPKDEFIDNVKDLIVKSKALKVQVAFLGLIPIDESKTNPCLWDKNIFYSNSSIIAYNTIIKQICKEYDVYFIDIYDKFKPLSSLLDDGLHPNSKGHNLIFDGIRVFFSKYVVAFRDK